MQQAEETCGQELATGANVPDQLGALFKHVAENLREHAAWVGNATPEAKREHEALLSAAERYESIGSEAQQTATSLRSFAQLPAAPHDPSKLDKQKLGAFLKKKVELQRKLAGALLEHAEQSQRVLDDLADA